MSSVAALALTAVVLQGAPAPPPAAVEDLGSSARGHPVRAIVLGDPRAERRVLVVGCIHGDECAGVAVTRRLVARGAPRGTALWIVHNVNPDGTALRVRQNGRGVDLNRNFGSEWSARGRRWDPEYPGPRAWSEPETRLVRRLVRRVRPDVTLWFHQPQGLVRAWGASRSIGRRYARLAGVRYRSIRWPPGSAPNWQNRRLRQRSFVVELPRGRLPAAAASRHARAVRLLARGL